MLDLGKNSRKVPSLLFCVVLDDSLESSDLLEDIFEVSSLIKFQKDVFRELGVVTMV